MIKKYLKLYKIFIANALSYEVQYRLDTWLKMGTNLLWIFMLFSIIEVIFSHTTTIVGWSKPDVYLLTVIWVLMDELFITLFRDNFYNFSTLTAEGELDFYLIKPVNTLFMVTTKKILTRSAYRFITQLLILSWLIYQYDFSVSVRSIPLFFLLLAIGLLIQYSYSLFFNIFNFWFLRIENMNEAIGIMSMSGRYPLEILPKMLKIISLTIIPIAFTAYIPVATLLGKTPWLLTIYAALFAIILFLISITFWNFAVRRYSSASS